MLIFFDIIFIVRSEFMLVDTHCHIYEEYYKDIDNLMDKVMSSGISEIINNGCNLDTSKEVIELSKLYNNMYYTIGLHPEENLGEINEVLSLIKSNMKDDKFVGIGEIGLDYYWNKDNKEEQIKILKKQLEFAQNYNLPVIIHSRESTGDMINILRKYNFCKRKCFIFYKVSARGS